MKKKAGFAILFFEMEHTYINDTLTMMLPEKVTSANSEAVREEALSLLEAFPAKSVVLDGDMLSYLSSAGLRVVLMLSKSVSDFHFVNVNLEVSNILEMTGFTSLIDVRRKMEEIDVTGMQVIGEGRTGIVYRMNKDTIVKVYKRDVSLEFVQREMQLSKESFVLGIPTAITFDIVKAGDKLASRFELLDCATFADVIKGDLEHLDHYLDEYCSLLKKINFTSSDALDLPSKKDSWIKHVSFCLPYLDETRGKKLEALVRNIPEVKTFIHGDCHMKNIMSDGTSLFLIDMGSLSTGYPIFELGALYRTFFGFDFIEKGNTEAFFEMDRKTLDDIFFGLMHRYFDAFNETIMDKIALVGLVYLISWNSRYEGDDKRRSQDAVARLIPLIDKVDDLTLPL